MKLIINIVMIFFLFSCTKKVVKETNVPIINYKTVDAYPLLPECESINNRDLQKACFYREIAKKIQTNLIDFKLDNTINSDTIFAKIFIDSNGKSHYKSTSIQHSALDSILTKSISSLPKMNPAIKKGIPVNIEFTLPIIID